MPITKMPTPGDKSNHREKIPEHHFPLPALVARPVSKKEVKDKLARGDHGPQDALNTEWSSLRDDECWDEENVIEFDDLIKQGEEFHWGYLFDICVEKNSELPPDSALRKYKGRVVFDGRRFRVGTKTTRSGCFRNSDLVLPP